MNIQQVENELKNRNPGWWERLTTAIPELSLLADTEQPPEYHAEGNVAIHTQLAVKACPPDCDPDLRWTALLHDIGKPHCSREINGRITAHNHDKVGAQIAAEILTRLEVPSERQERIVWAIRHHLFHLSWQLQTLEQASKKHRAFVADPNFPLLLELVRVDTLATITERPSRGVHAFFKEFLELVKHEQPSAHP